MKGLGAVLALFACILGAWSAQAAAAPEVSLDTVVSGNTPRSAGPIDECVSVDVGTAFEVDVILGEAGIGPLGIAGFEFRLYFDPQVVRLTTEDPRQLLAQAASSSLFPVGGQMPNDTGEYLSVALDFGARGTEPGGSSELGGGVLSRVGIEAVGRGETNLRLQQVELVDDAENKISPTVAEPARVVVGGSCDTPTRTEEAAPVMTAAATPQPTDIPRAATTVLPLGGAGVPGAPAQPASPAAVPVGGGPPATDGSFPTIYAGLTLLIGGSLAVALASGFGGGPRNLRSAERRERGE